MACLLYTSSQPENRCPKPVQRAEKRELYPVQSGRAQWFRPCLRADRTPVSSTHLTLTNETVKCNFDRGRRFTVDTMDDLETAGLAFRCV